MSTLVVREMSPATARAITDKIKGAAQRLYRLLSDAHEGKAWKALGYDSWESYVRAEFDMSRSRSYQLLDQGRVVRAIEAAVSTSVDITEAEARDLKPILAEVVEDITDAVADVEPDARAEIVEDVIERRRLRRQEKRAVVEAMKNSPVGFLDPHTGKVTSPDSVEHHRIMAERYPVLSTTLTDEETERVQASLAMVDDKIDLGPVNALAAEGRWDEAVLLYMKQVGYCHLGDLGDIGPPPDDGDLICWFAGIPRDYYEELRLEVAQAVDRLADADRLRVLASCLKSKAKKHRHEGDCEIRPNGYVELVTPEPVDEIECITVEAPCSAGEIVGTMSPERMAELFA